MSIELTDLHADHGSIVEFKGVDLETEQEVIVAADRRPASAIWAGLVAGETVIVDPEDWAVRWVS